MSAPQIVSWVLIVGTVACAIYGGWRGAISQAASVLAFLLGFFGARLFAPTVAAHLALPSILCFAVVYAIIYLCVILVARALRLTVRMLLLGWLDRIIGSIIGDFKWLLVTSLLINVLLLCAPDCAYFSAPYSQWVCGFARRLFGLALTLYQTA